MAGRFGSLLLRVVGAAALALALAAAPAGAGPRVMSLDQCADQYVMALAPRADIAGLSFRADDADSYLRKAAAGLPLRRADLETVLAARPQLVVRYWGGDAVLVRRLEARGVRVVRIEDAQDFDGVRGNVRRIAAALGRSAVGEALVGRMDADLARAKGAWRGRRALYLTPGGYTAGDDTLIGAMMRAAGLSSAAAAPGFSPVPLERLVAEPPAAFVLGFFDPASMSVQRWSIGRHGALRRAMAGRPVVELPAAVLGCPGWFAADGALALARQAPRP